MKNTHPRFVFAAKLHFWLFFGSTRPQDCCFFVIEWSFCCLNSDKNTPKICFCCEVAFLVVFWKHKLRLQDCCFFCYRMKSLLFNYWKKKTSKICFCYKVTFLGFPFGSEEVKCVILWQKRHSRAFVEAMDGLMEFSGDLIRQILCKSFFSLSLFLSFSPFFSSLLLFPHSFTTKGLEELKYFSFKGVFVYFSHNVYDLQLLCFFSMVLQILQHDTIQLMFKHIFWK